MGSIPATVRTFALRCCLGLTGRFRHVEPGENMGDCTFNESDFDVPVRSLRNDARAMLCPALIHRALLAGELGQGSATARYHHHPFYHPPQ